MSGQKLLLSKKLFKPRFKTELEFCLHSEDSRERQRVERTIAGSYKASYNANITEFLPLLLEMQMHGSSQAAVGMRPANCGSLFLEHYLDKTIEQRVAETLCRPIGRDSLIEIGNLSTSARGASHLMFVVMAAAIHAAGFHWMVFTATPQVSKLISKFDYQPTFLKEADASRLGNKVTQWGSYYTTRPKVMLVDAEEAVQTLQNNPLTAALIEQYTECIAEIAGMLRDFQRVCGI